jgi:hypothetical protein
MMFPGKNLQFPVTIACKPPEKRMFMCHVILDLFFTDSWVIAPAIQRSLTTLQIFHQIHRCHTVARIKRDKNEYREEEA